MNSDLSALSPDGLATRLLALLPSSLVMRRHIGSGGAVFRQGDRVAAVFVVEAGRVRLARVLADGAPLILYVAETGDSFAEASLSADCYHCDAIAETNAVVLSLPKTALLSALAADPHECLVLALALARQVRDLRTRLEVRNIRSATERVLAWLRLHASGNPPSVPMHRSWTQVADELGLTREAVYRALARLEHQQRINRRSGLVELAPYDGT